ncbi:hypothetical protein B5V01_12305 [Mesorhizobium erdmanii]|uniref:Uncharacterized protein n=2 Tax=Mesorhizobium TaxID=68287 RepID=A0A3M9XDK3_9HYPH|nr:MULTISPECIES: hypothetical protein [Mesorhizobium]RNJ46024.1 hypothetical protein DNR46_11455 [Mesorhizobium japonicum]RXT47332.1 hypothetical protein B5V01_12305 [Mesorhizobium erdmanii]
MRTRLEAAKISEQLHARSSSANITTLHLIEAIIFYERTIHADNERDATTDLKITLSSVLPSPAAD